MREKREEPTTGLRARRTAKGGTRLLDDVRARAGAGAVTDNVLGELAAAEGLELAVVGLKCAHDQRMVRALLGGLDLGDARTKPADEDVTRDVVAYTRKWQSMGQ